jgi:hypothetical protein
VLSASRFEEALVSGGYQIAFQANIAYGPWFVDDGDVPLSGVVSLFRCGSVRTGRR